jgi:hypothetical protein
VWGIGLSNRPKEYGKFLNFIFAHLHFHAVMHHCLHHVNDGHNKRIFRAGLVTFAVRLQTEQNIARIGFNNLTSTAI